MKQHPIAFSLALALTGTVACKSGEQAPQKETVTVIGKSTVSATATPAGGGSATAMAQPVRPGDLPPPSDVAAAPAGDLTFDVELLEIQKGAEPPAVPTDLAKPPATAKKTKSGLAYRYLTKGKGTVHPKATDKVNVHYSGWTKDGKMFDSSVTRGKPISFPLNGVIKGWTEGVQLMVAGDKVRFWIPADLAYGDKPEHPGAPTGELVFDVELLEIQ